MTHQCISIMKRWFPPIRFKPTPPARKDISITFKNIEKLLHYHGLNTEKLFTSLQLTSGITADPCHLAFVLTLFSVQEISFGMSFTVTGIALFTSLTSGPLESLLKASTSSALFLAGTSPLIVEHRNPALTRWCSTTINILVHCDTITLQRYRRILHRKGLYWFILHTNNYSTKSTITIN